MIQRLSSNYNMRKKRLDEIKRRSPYYPKYISGEINNTGLRQKTYWISSNLRIEHNGTWYKVHHYNEYTTIEEAGESREDSRIKLINEFMHAAYLSMKFYKVDPNLTDPEGDPVNEVDVIQVSEAERLGL